MSLQATDEDQLRSDQIALHFYTKLFHLVHQARAFPPDLHDRPRPRVDRWFNLEVPDSDLFPRELREIYKSLSSLLAASRPLSPPLRIHVLLVVPDSNNSHVLVTLSQSNTPQHKTTSRILIEPTPKYVLLETWKMQFTPNPDHAQLHTPADVALPTIYKHAIPLFRSLYSLLRILPTWKLFKKLRRRTNSAAQLGIQLRATESGDHTDGNVLGFDNPPTTGHPPLPTLTHVFPSIPHPLGSFTLSTTYLESPTFQLDDLESLLSSKFISLDEGGFVPTLSSATTATMAHPPATAAATTTTNTGTTKQQRIADRFVIPSPSTSSTQGQGHFSHLRQPSLLHHRHHSDTHSSGSSPPSTTVPLPAALSRLKLESSNYPSTTSSTSPHRPTSLLLSPTTSHNSSPSPTSKSAFTSPPLQQAHTPPHSTVPLPSLPSLLSLHSLPSVPSLPLSPSSPSPTSTQALPIKRPGTINPFKTNTLLSGSGTSAGTGAGGQPGSAGSIHSVHSIYSHSGSISSLRHTNTSSPLSREGRESGGGRDLSRSPPGHLQPLPFPTSSGGSGGGKHGSSSSPTSSPGPTFQKLGASSGFGSGSGHGGEGIGLPGQRKRYSSSFTHRYASSVSSAGSEARDRALEVVSVPVPESAERSPVSSSPRGRGDDKSSSRSSSFLGKRTEDDDISMFMQDIETRKPLVGRRRMGEGTQETHRRERTEGSEGTDRTVRAESGSSLASEGTVRDERTDLGDESDDEAEEDEEGEDEEARRSKERYLYTRTLHPSPAGYYSDERPNPSSASPPGAIPTSQADVEVRLKKMNEAFLKSLVGLDGGWGGGGQSGSSGSGSVPSTSSTAAVQMRSRDGERLRRLMSQQGSEEVIGPIELSGSGGSGRSRLRETTKGEEE